MTLGIFDINKFNPKKNMFIEASAGTGKTYTIQQIVVKLIAGDISNNVEPVDLKNIAIVTFTEKAAGELKDRIRKKLTEVVENKILPDGKKLSDEQLKHFEEELSSIDEASIFTIHSFCKKILSEYSFIANQPLSLGLVDEGEIDSYFEEWIRDNLSKDSYFENKFINDEERWTYLKNLKRDLIHGAKKYYLNFNEQEDKKIVSFDSTGIVINGESYSKSDYEAIKAAKTIEDLFIIKDFERNYRVICNNTHIPQVQNFKDNLDQCDVSNLFEGSRFKSGMRGMNRFPEITDEFDYFKNVKADIKVEYNYEEIEFIESKVKEIYKGWLKEKQKRQVQSFDDMIRNIREAVSMENSLLLKKLKKIFKYGIIDEFQDTNQLQWDIFKSIFTGDDSHSIFVVGDPKQSIYRFQKADIDVYKNATSEILNSGGEGAVLNNNWRSSEGIINACNYLFSSEFFSSDSGFNFEPSYYPPVKKETDAYFKGEKVRPFWITPYAKLSDDKEIGITPKAFAYLAVQKIIQCCSYSETDSEKTNLQIHRKDDNELHNVSFKDFAVLCRSKSEMSFIKNAFVLAGVPFSHYKDSNLFEGKECLQWASLFNAVAASDFTGRNRSLLSDALFTDFFQIPFEELKNEKFDIPSCPERQTIVKWQGLARNGAWAKLFESIYRDTKIEEKLSNLEDLASLSKLRQIGNYSLEYLYNNSCSLETLVKHLLQLSENSGSVDEEDGNLVAKGSDFDAVKIMTIHASKGLEFPVVIAAGGFKGEVPADKIPNAYIYHDKTGKQVLNFTDIGKKANANEEKMEYERFFYVAYTRAESLMMIPQYEDWGNSRKVKLNFLKNSFKSFTENPEAQDCFEYIIGEKKSWNDMKTAVNEILSRKEIQLEDENAKKSQQKELKLLIKKLPELKSYKHSYTSLSHGNTALSEEISTEENGRIEKEGAVATTSNLSRFDSKAVAASLSYSSEKCAGISETYPKGTKLGEAIHRVFQFADYEEAGKISYQEALTDENLKSLIVECFESQSLHIDEEDSKKWKDQTASFVWNTLNAEFPEICGSEILSSTFSLNEIPSQKKKAEAEFNFNPHDEKWIRNYCNGFIDLMFQRQINGKTVYSILDWKSDSLDEEDYCNQKKIESHVNRMYSIQRVLYSYTLIKWLKGFYNLTEEEIFQNHFGGIYYVLVRGCKAGSSNGIYAQTWKSWADLEEAFAKIRSELIDAKIANH